jgi:hypothetical protein
VISRAEVVVYEAAARLDQFEPDEPPRSANVRVARHPTQILKDAELFTAIDSLQVAAAVPAFSFVRSPIESDHA